MAVPLYSMQSDRLCRVSRLTLSGVPTLWLHPSSPTVVGGLLSRYDALSFREKPAQLSPWLPSL